MSPCTLRIRARLHRLRKNSPMPALTWKSGASALHKAFRIVRASALVVFVSRPGEAFFRSRFTVRKGSQEGRGFSSTRFVTGHGFSRAKSHKH